MRDYFQRIWHSVASGVKSDEMKFSRLKDGDFDGIIINADFFECVILFPPFSFFYILQ